MRFVAAQFSALLRDDLWRANATHANVMARRLAEERPPWTAWKSSTRSRPTPSSPGCTRGTSPGLQRDWTFHVWDEHESVVRWMTAFDTTEADVDVFLADIRSAASR